MPSENLTLGPSPKGEGWLVPKRFAMRPLSFSSVSSAGEQMGGEEQDADTARASMPGLLERAP